MVSVGGHIREPSKIKATSTKLIIYMSYGRLKGGGGVFGYVKLEEGGWYSPCPNWKMWVYAASVMGSTPFKSP